MCGVRENTGQWSCAVLEKTLVMCGVRENTGHVRCIFKIDVGSKSPKSIQKAAQLFKTSHNLCSIFAQTTPKFTQNFAKLVCQKVKFFSTDEVHFQKMVIPTH